MKESAIYVNESITVRVTQYHIMLDSQAIPTQITPLLVAVWTYWCYGLNSYCNAEKAGLQNCELGHTHSSD